MKTIYTLSLITVFAAVTSLAAAQDYPDEYLGLPGDNMNLYAVMNLFQESETLEAFERSLNDKENTINNLDLNGDNFVDYITVSDYAEKNFHTIVLRTALNQNEQQDVAVFVVEQLKNDVVQIQLIGDEALYGPNYIVEPIYAETPNPGYSGNVTVNNSSYYEIASWPVVRFIYQPRYRVWRSSWYWGYYPSYWHAWTPHYWHYYYGYHSHWHNHYYSHYRHWDHYRGKSYNTYYRNNVRVYSRTVIRNVNNGHYRDTYSRPAQRRAGEQHYAQSALQRANTRGSSVSTQRSDRRSGTVSQSQGTQRTTRTTTNPRSKVSTNPRSQSVTRSTTRSSSQRSTPAVKTRNTSQRSTPAVSRSSSQRSTPTVKTRSTSQRSTPAVSRSSSQRSTPAVK
ncbi:MAG: hypothetical protein QNK33_05310, partial [Bacteroidales bacterium]|nr:hypothetical protein [Bacteroidales bacterium]